MIIGVPKESLSGETRVAILPEEIQRLSSDELAFRVETGAGKGSFIADENYSGSGAKLLADVYPDSDLIVRINPPSEQEVSRFKDGSCLVSLLNPFTNHVLISYELNKRTDVKLSIFDVYGNLVQILVNQNQRPGNHQIEWSGNDRPAGIYFCRLKYENKIKHTRMLLIK
jgi:alanine dehydrogenase